MEPDSSTASGRGAARSPVVFAFYGAVATAVVAAGLAYALWPQGGAPAGGPGGAPGGGFAMGPSPVEVVTAVETMAAEPVRLIGEVTPLREAVVAGEVEGRVAELLVDEGDRVRTGDVLARLDTTTAELDLTASRASEAEAQARLVRFESEVRRVSDLRQRRAVSEREYEQAVADRDAQAQTVARIDSEAARLEELIERAEIRAPFAGQVAAVHTELGEWIGRGGDVATLVDLSEVEVTVNAPERYVGQVEQARVDGLEVPVVFEALPGDFRGHVKAVLPQANPQARTFPVIVVVPNPDGAIRAGMSAQVLAQVGAAVPTVLVPKDSLVLRSGRTFVYRVVPMQGGGGRGAPAGGEGTATSGDASGGAPAGPPPSGVEEIEVTLGSAYGEWQAVAGGVNGGDEVVVRGNENLRPGMPVVVAGVADIAPPPAPSGDLPSARSAGGGR
ncbi:MAG: efflux RND transporter periplasmic adaptor subunit [Acidobacteriota bacterium]|jgi:RND family efflux transporter MFP subunit